MRPGLRGDRVVADRGERRRVAHRVVIPRVPGGEVADLDVTAGGALPAEHLADVSAGPAPRVAAARPDQRAGREGLPPREVRRRRSRVVDDHAPGVAAGIEPRDPVAGVEIADARDVRAGRHAAGGLVVESLRLERGVRRDQGDAVLDQQQHHVVERVGSIEEAVQVADTGADRERVVGTARSLDGGNFAFEGQGLDERRRCGLGRVVHCALPREQRAVAGVDDHAECRVTLAAHLRLVRRDDARAHGREGDGAHALNRPGGRDAELRPAAGGLLAALHLRDRVRSAGAARCRREALGYGEPGPPVERRVGGQRGGHERDAPTLLERAAQADGDQTAVDALEAAEDLAEVDRVAAARREPRVADELEARGGTEPEERPVLVDPPAGRVRSVLPANALGQVLATLRQRGRGSKLVPGRLCPEPLDRGTLGVGGCDRSRPGVVVAQGIALLLDLRDSEGRGREDERAEGRRHGDPPETQASHCSPLSS